jgi:outer membrane protein assembly factor BamB
MKPLTMLFSLVAAAWAGSAAAVDPVGPNNWPQWEGPSRDAICPEKGLLQKWPQNGPPLLWQAKSLGLGYSTPVVMNGVIYGMSWRGEEDGVWALNEADQKELWFTPIGPADKRIDRAHGPRSSPTIDGQNLYALTANGDLACLDLSSGSVKWKSSFKQQLGGKMMSMWGFSESPLVDGDKVIATPGGDENTVVAFNKESGSILWKSSIRGGGGAGYASPVAMTVGGKKLYVTSLGTCFVGVDAETGKELWRYSKVSGRVANIPTPRVRGDLVLLTTGYTGYNAGIAMLKIVPSGGGFKADEKWYLGPREFGNHHGGIVWIGDFIYGGHGQNKGMLTCIDARTGKIKYTEPRAAAGGSAALLYADGCLYYRYEDGNLFLVKASPESKQVISKFKLPYDSGKPSWPHPVICNGRLFIRDMDVLMCFDVKAK